MKPPRAEEEMKLRDLRLACISRPAGHGLRVSEAYGRQSERAGPPLDRDDRGAGLGKALESAAPKATGGRAFDHHLS